MHIAQCASYNKVLHCNCFMKRLFCAVAVLQNSGIWDARLLNITIGEQNIMSWEDIHPPQRSFAKGMEGDYTSTDVAAAEGSKVILEHK